MLLGAARLMLERQEELARIATMEEGKPLAESRLEVMMKSACSISTPANASGIYGRELVRPDGHALDRAATSRSARSPPSRRGTSRSAIPGASSARRSPRAAR